MTHFLLLTRPVLVGSLALVATAFLAGTVQGQTSSDIMKATLAQPNEKTAEVSTDELRRMLAEGSATVFDARPHLEFAISHIPGALNVAPKAGVPMSLYVSDTAEIGRVLGDRKEAAIVLYCNGPFCGKSKRLAEELTAAGYTNVRRYQLGAPVWRALVGVMQIEPDGIRYVRESDKTAVFFDVRSADEVQNGNHQRRTSSAQRRGGQSEGRWEASDGGSQHPHRGLREGCGAGQGSGGGDRQERLSQCELLCRLALRPETREQLSSTKVLLLLIQIRSSRISIGPSCLALY